MIGIFIKVFILSLGMLFGLVNIIKWYSVPMDGRNKNRKTWNVGAGIIIMLLCAFGIGLVI